MLPQIGVKAQECINLQITDYDIFLGIMWKRFGTKTDNADSGTEEEFRIAYEKRKQFPQLHILFYFSQMPYSPKNHEEIEQWGKVMAFKEKLEKIVLIRNYYSIDEFTKMVQNHLSMILRNKFSPQDEVKEISDFKGYLTKLSSDCMYMDIRGLVTGENKAHQFRIDQLYIPLKTTGGGIHEEKRGKKIKFLRADSAAYQVDIMNFCEEEGLLFAIGADLDKSVLAAIENIPEKDWKEYKNGYIAETVHCMNKTKKAFRLILIRRPYQRNLFTEEEPSIKYIVISTNRTESAEYVIGWYNQRGEHTENRIKDLKIGFGMERMPCGQFEANAVFFRIGVLAYNLFRLFVLKSPDKSWHRRQVQTIRWRLYQIAGKIVYHSNEISLKLNRRFL